MSRCIAVIAGTLFEKRNPVDGWHLRHTECAWYGAWQRIAASNRGRSKPKNCRDVRLDVIDNNPRAHELCEREGFVAGKVQMLGPLKHFFGFSSATEMRFTLHSHS